MTDTRAAPPAAPGTRAPRATPRPMPLALMRAVVTLVALGVFTQPVLAGQFLSGNGAMQPVHGMVASLLELLTLLQVIFAVILWRPGRGPGWVVFVSLGLFLVVYAQAVFGYIPLLAIHVPLGVLLVTGMLLLLIWVWRPRAASHPAEPPSSPS